jgi:predicted ester cyclase
MTEDLKAIARRELEMYSTGALDVADEIIAGNYVGHDPAQPEPLRGPEGVKQSAQGYRAAFPDLTVTVERQVAEGDLVVTHWRARGTHQGELFGIAPTGRQATITGISIARITGGKIVEDWTVWDTYGLLVQLGAIPQPAAARA